MSNITPGDGERVQVTYATGIFRVGFTLPEGIDDLRLDRNLPSDDEPDVYTLSVTVRAPDPVTAQQKILELRRRIVAAVKVVE
jgi:hypothetical protein